MKTGIKSTIGDLTAAFLFALLARTVVYHWHGVVDAGLIFYNLLLVALFISRRPATQTDREIIWGLAVLATILPLVAYAPARGLSGTGVWTTGEVIQVLSLGGIVWSAASLGPAIGIGPADRGLVQAGPYRYIRHPLYTFESLFGLGYLLVNPSLRNGLTLTVLIALQVFRALREERIIEGYIAYQLQVPCRFIPRGIFGQWLRKQCTRVRKEAIP